MMARTSPGLFFSSLVIVALLTVCGHPAPAYSASGPSAAKTSSASPAGQSAAPATSGASAYPSSGSDVQDRRPVIVAFGDSLTAGYGTGPGHSYPAYLQRDLNARGYRYRVVNAGISGNTSKDGVARLPRVLALHPAIALVEFGGNDGLRGIPIQDTEKNLKTIISTLQRAHVQVILAGITLPPNYGRPYIHKFDVMYATVAHTLHVPLLPFMLRGAEKTPGDIQPDGVHATAKGNRRVAKNFLPLLLPMLHKPAGPEAARKRK